MELGCCKQPDSETLLCNTVRYNDDLTVRRVLDGEQLFRIYPKYVIE